jgi:signal transduction histidine kinase
MGCRTQYSGVQIEASLATGADVTMEQIKPKPEICRRGESPHRLREAECIDLQEQVTELAAQQAAMTEILSSIANSPHKLEPIFDLVTANATRLCRAEVGALILFEGRGYRLVARAGEVDTYYIKGHLYPAIDGAPSARMIENRSPVHIADLAADQAYLQRIPELVALVERIGVRTYLLIPMLKRDQIVGGIAVARACVQPFTDRQIKLISAFAAQATIALENTCRERQLRQMQTDLTYATRLVALEQLSASIAHEIKQPISAVSTFAQSALRWMDRRSPVLEEVRQALSNIVSANQRADDIVGRITDLIKKAPPRKVHLEINGAIRDVIEFIRGEAAKNGVSVRMDLAQSLPLVQGDRVQLQQVILNLIMNAVEAMGGVDGARELIISTEAAEPEGVLIAVRDFGPGLTPALRECAFNAFYTTKSGGLGVGLSISRSIIEAHGGRLWASENEPRGALFQFTLPRGDRRDHDQVDTRTSR